MSDDAKSGVGESSQAEKEQTIHEAVRLAGIAETGPLLPLLSNVPESEQPPIRDAARRLLEAERAANAGDDQS